MPTAYAAPTPPSASPPAPAAAPLPKTFPELLADQRANLDACYAAARRADVGLGRTSIAFTFTVDELGKPVAVEIQYRNRLDDGAKECLRDAALALSFPTTMQGRKVATLEFKPAAIPAP